MADDFEKSSIERLKRTLYSRNEKVVPKEKRTAVSEGEELDVPTNWGREPSFDIPLQPDTKQNNSFFNKFLIGSLIFFVISLAVALVIFFGGFNMISSNNVNIVVTTPSSVSSGEQMPIALSVVNGNPTDLTSLSLFIDYPDGVQSALTPGKVLSHDQIDLGTIVKGQSKDYTVQTLLFGQKDAIKTFTLRIEYKVAGSNAVFSKTKTFDVLISSSPILLDVSSPSEVNSGDTVTLSINVTSNSSVVVQNSMVKVAYPYGFTYTDSNIKPLRDNSVWNLGDLKGGDKKTLIVRGVLIGQDLEDRSFQISVGTQNQTSPTDFSTALATSIATVGIRKSFFNLTLTSTADGTAPLGQFVPVTVSWENTLPDQIVQSHIEATLSGNVFDRSKVSANNGGFFRSLDNTILWDKNSTTNLKTIAPGEQGQVSFSVGSFASSVQTLLTKNPHIDAHVVITGNRLGTSAGAVSSSADITIKIPTTLSVASQAYRNNGTFSNTGSIPPKADVESTYTIVWTLTNTSNDLASTTVSATLPSGIQWKNEISPASERISYNTDTRVVSWDAGNIYAATGFTYPAKQVSFKVGIIPSVNQIGSAPAILGDAEAFSADTYTGTQVKAGANPLTTRFSDTSFKSPQDIVTK